MDRRKRFTALLTAGVLLLLTPVVIKLLAGNDDATVGLKPDFYPYQDQSTGKWGFIDAEGNEVVEAVFDWAGDFRHGRGLAESNGGMGFIDASFAETGKWAISPRFETRDASDMPAHGFSDGLALVRHDDGNWGYIGVDGKWAIDPRFPESRDHPGVPCGDFADGLAWFQSVRMSERYLLNDQGKMARDAQNKPVMERYASRSFGYIDRTGEEVIPARFEMAQDFGEGLAAVRVKTHDTWGFIDRSGRQTISPRFEAVDRFSEGLCAVKEDGLWGYINPKGQWVIRPTFAEARQFLEGLAAARDGDRWGYIDPKGDWVIAPAYDDFDAYGHPGDPHAFENGIARVTLNGAVIYINTQGQRVWPKQ